MAPTSGQLKLICDSLRNQGAPFVCPIGGCGRSYKTFSGIQFHICNTRHEASAILAACERSRSLRKDNSTGNKEAAAAAAAAAANINNNSTSSNNNNNNNNNSSNSNTSCTTTTSSVVNPTTVSATSSSTTSLLSSSAAATSGGSPNSKEHKNDSSHHSNPSHHQNHHSSSQQQQHHHHQHHHQQQQPHPRASDHRMGGRMKAFMGSSTLNCGNTSSSSSSSSNNNNNNPPTQQQTGGSSDSPGGRSSGGGPSAGPVVGTAAAAAERMKSTPGGGSRAPEGGTPMLSTAAAAARAGPPAAVTPSSSSSGPSPASMIIGLAAGAAGAGQGPREGLTYAEAQKVVEIDVDGGLYRLNIEEPLNVILTSEPDPLGQRPEGARQPEKSRSPHKTAKSKKARLSKAGAKMAGNSGGSAGDRTGTGDMSVRLPEAVVALVEDYACSDAPQRPVTYYRFTEKTPEELDEMVEYDMDEEDTAWLEIINRKRKKQGISSEVTGDTFELLMDRLEKESYFQAQNAPSSGAGGGGSAIDDDAVCAICQDGECHNANAILFCDMCNLAVHQECYGVPYIPEGQWLCRRCLQSPSRAVDCVLCPNRGGAFKQTSDGRWGHVVCALWVPEVYFANTVFLEPIDNICNIPAARWKLTCYICKKRGQGACIQCHKANCYTAFHVTCAQQAGLYMKLEECKSGEQSGVRKTAFCDSHAPITYKKADKMRSARKILQERAKALPVVSIPTIPEERMMHVASLVSLPRKADFLQRLVGYWTLKRQSRNGVSLLRRLQMSHLSSRHSRNEPDLDSTTAAMRDQLKYWQRLRQDLERARLLCELIRKREKLKREFIRLRERHFLTEVGSLPKTLDELITLLQEKDPHRIFAEPVDTNEVTDYLTLIKEPMDFSTMRAKAKQLEYGSFADFERDFNLIVSNCMTYNAKDTIFYKAAVKLRDRGGAIIRAHREQLISAFDYNTGRILAASVGAAPSLTSASASAGGTGPDVAGSVPNAAGDPDLRRNSAKLGSDQQPATGTVTVGTCRTSGRRSDTSETVQQQQQQQQKKPPASLSKLATLTVQEFLRSDEYRRMSPQAQVTAVKSRQQTLALEDASPIRSKRQRLLRCELVKLRRKLSLEKKASERREATAAATDETTADVVAASGTAANINSSSSVTVNAGLANEDEDEAEDRDEDMVTEANEVGFGRDNNDEESGTESDSTVETDQQATLAVTMNNHHHTGNDTNSTTSNHHHHHHNHHHHNHHHHHHHHSNNHQTQSQLRQHGSTGSSPQQQRQQQQQQQQQQSPTAATTTTTTQQPQKESFKIYREKGSDDEDQDDEDHDDDDDDDARNEDSEDANEEDEEADDIDSEEQEGQEEEEEEEAAEIKNENGIREGNHDNNNNNDDDDEHNDGDVDEDHSALSAAVAGGGERNHRVRRQGTANANRVGNSKSKTAAAHGPKAEPRTPRADKDNNNDDHGGDDDGGEATESDSGVETVNDSGHRLGAGDGGGDSINGIKTAGDDVPHSDKSSGGALSSSSSSSSSPVLATVSRRGSKGRPKVTGGAGKRAAVRAVRPRQRASNGSAKISGRRAAAAAAAASVPSDEAAASAAGTEAAESGGAGFSQRANSTDADEHDELTADDGLRDSEGGLDEQKLYEIPLEPLDLVWAKCRGYPWYPALIIDPDAAAAANEPAGITTTTTPTSTATTSAAAAAAAAAAGPGTTEDGRQPAADTSDAGGGVSIPTPPPQVLQLRPRDRDRQRDREPRDGSHRPAGSQSSQTNQSSGGVQTGGCSQQQQQQQLFLVLFFDAKRTWQWLPRSKLVPLGPDADTDKKKLQASRKPAERKAVKKAFEEAIAHRCRVARATGEDPMS